MAEWIRGERSVDIAAPLERCFAILADVEAYPDWQAMVREVRVLERDEQRRPLVAETVAVTQARAVRYALHYAYDPPRRIAWRQTQGDLRDLEGEFVLEPAAPDRTVLTYRLGVLPSGRLALLMRAPLFPQVAGWFMSQALDEIRARCESPA